MRVPRLVVSVAGCLILTLADSRAAPTPTDLEIDEQVLKQGGLETDASALLAFFRRRTPTAEDRKNLSALIEQLDNNQFSARQEASAKLEEHGWVALPFLRAASKGKSLEVTRRVERAIEMIEHTQVAGLSAAAVRLLRQRRPKETCGVLLDYLPYADDRAVEEEVLVALLAVGQNKGKAGAELVAALKDREPARRGAAALAMLRSNDPAQRAAARPLLTDGNALVRLRAAQALLLARDRDALPLLLGLLAETPPIALQAEEILVGIAGAAAPTAALRPGNADACRACRQAWKDWFGKHGSKLHLPPMDDFRCQLGYTLIVEFADGINDRLVELGPDARPRWQIDNLQYPVDAAVLRDNRVLIVEYNAKRVSERDFKGTIIWEKTMEANEGGPFAAQRLPNGHTFIVSHQQMLEVDARGKEVWRQKPDGFQYLGAHKNRDGQIVYLTSQGNCVRLDPAGKIAKSFPSRHALHWVSGIDVLPGGNLLIPQHADNKVVEFDPDGKVIWEAKMALPKSATRLPNGRTLVTSFENGNVVELDRAGNVVWEYKEGTHPYRARRR